MDFPTVQVGVVALVAFVTVSATSCGLISYYRDCPLHRILSHALTASKQRGGPQRSADLEARRIEGSRNSACAPKSHVNHKQNKWKNHVVDL